MNLYYFGSYCEFGGQPVTAEEAARFVAMMAFKGDWYGRIKTLRWKQLDDSDSDDFYEIILRVTFPVEGSRGSDDVVDVKCIFYHNLREAIMKITLTCPVSEKIDAIINEEVDLCEPYLTTFKKSVIDEED